MSWRCFWCRCCGPSKSPLFVHARHIEELYELIEEIGAGKTGKVYRGVHRETRQVVAIKIIQTSYLSTPSRVRSLDQEIDILAHSNHRSIVQLYQVVENDVHVALVTEYADGGEVLAHLVRQDVLTEAQVCHVIKEVASVLVDLHSRGITHRDLKPENVLFASHSDDDAPVHDDDDDHHHRAITLIDFGVSHRGRMGRHDMTGMAGTGHFMAPEIFGRQAHYGCEIDIWSLGIMTYVMLFGAYPFDAPFLSQMEDKIREGKYDFPPDLESHVSENARNFIHRLLQYRPTDRPLAIELVEHPWLGRNGAASRPFSDAHHEKLRQYIRSREPTTDVTTTATTTIVHETSEDNIYFNLEKDRRTMMPWTRIERNDIRT